MPTHRTINLGILAHVDAGKTSLTERLLFDTGAIDTLGSVEAGTTATDTGTVERQRGITVRSAVVSFTHNDIHVNVIDTPGHSDFVAEVDRALAVVDAVVLVVSAVEGVQSHTRALMRVLRTLRMPTLIFINKIDRHGARVLEVLTGIRQQLSPHVLPMTTVTDSDSRGLRVVSETLEDKRFRELATELLANVDDAVLARAVDGPAPSPTELSAMLQVRTVDAGIYPLYVGSARTGVGIAALLDGITELLSPCKGSSAIHRAPATAPRGRVFALEHTSSGTKIAYLRLFEGTVAVRQRVSFERHTHDGSTDRHRGRITSLSVIGSTEVNPRCLRPGDIGTITGLPLLQVGDILSGTDDLAKAARQGHFATPTLRTVVRPRNCSSARLHMALQRITEQDPLLHARLESDGTSSVLLYGEIQKEIVATTLAREFGIDAEFQAAQPICVERVVGSGEAVEAMGHRSQSPSGFWATVGVRVESSSAGSGVAFRRETRLGALPRAFHRAIEDSVRARLRCGPNGMQVTDCLVTLTAAGFAGPVTTAGDFRGLTPIVVDRALTVAGTQLLEPYHRFEIDFPAHAFAAVATYLANAGAEIEDMATAENTRNIRGTIPVRLACPVQLRLADLTHGECAWWSVPAGYRPVVRADGLRESSGTRRLMD